MSGPVPYFSDDMVTLHLGDCVDVLAGMEPESVDVVVCDPPYAINFMGRDWDDFGRQQEYAERGGYGDKGILPGYGRGGRNADVNRYRLRAARQYQEWCETWAAECLRILKPGGWLLAFGGTRTYHRLTCGIEDAGFEIRDSLHWIYGCLTADAEILTEHGWKPGIDVIPGERVAQWDHETGRVSLAPVQEVFRAPWDGPMRVLRNADTDQLLTPNHRVYHQPRRRQMTEGVRRAWYDGHWQVAEAGTLSTWNPVRLPIAGEHDGPGIGGEDYAALLGWVWTEGGFDLGNSNGVRIYQSSVNAAKVDEIAALLDRLGPHKRYDYERTYVRRNGQSHPHIQTTWFFTGDLAARVRADLPGKRPTYGLLWRMTGAEKRALLRAAMLGDGSGYGTRSEQFYQQHEDDLIWLQTLLALTGRAGKIGMRRNRPGGALYLRSVSTTELQARHLRNVTEHYTGEVWCVRVPSGAFVARRNGRVFITGNSGFPKSLDVSKAIDKAAGTQREIVAEGKPLKRMIPGADQNRTGSWIKDNGREFVPAETVPATEDAARWSGWGTALKPSHEPIVVARKPLAGPVAQNVLEHGTGALNIDGCRVGTGDALVRPFVKRDDNEVYGKGLGAGVQDEPAGRWPPNVLLTHSAGCEMTGTRRVRGSRIDKPAAVLPDDRSAYGSGLNGARPARGIGDADGMETVEAWDCAPDCPVAELDRQSGVSKSTGGKGLASQRTALGGDVYGEYSHSTLGRNAGGLGDTGGASRFFPVFRYEAKATASERPRSADGTAHPTVKPLDLMAWLVRLVTPPGGVVLDPFAGSGTTGEACIVEGFRCVLVEKDPAYAELIKTRLSKPIQPTMFGLEAS